MKVLQKEIQVTEESSSQFADPKWTLGEKNADMLRKWLRSAVTVRREGAGLVKRKT